MEEFLVGTQTLKLKVENPIHKRMSIIIISFGVWVIHHYDVLLHTTSQGNEYKILGTVVPTME
jgi:hypothetical protein